MTKTFRFIGARTEFRRHPAAGLSPEEQVNEALVAMMSPSLTLTKLGQSFQALEAEVLADGGIPALPESDFIDIFEDIPPEMLERYALAETRIDPPAELAAAIKAAAIRLHELRGGK